eukprot:900527-Pyramimonas_sp.AAC.1
MADRKKQSPLTMVPRTRPPASSAGSKAGLSAAGGSGRQTLLTAASPSQGAQDAPDKDGPRSKAARVPGRLTSRFRLLSFINKEKEKKCQGPLICMRKSCAKKHVSDEPWGKREVV